MKILQNFFIAVVIRIHIIDHKKNTFEFIVRSVLFIFDKILSIYIYIYIYIYI